MARREVARGSKRSPARGHSTLTCRCLCERRGWAADGRMRRDACPPRRVVIVVSADLFPAVGSTRRGELGRPRRLFRRFKADDVGPSGWGCRSSLRLPSSRPMSPESPERLLAFGTRRSAQRLDVGVGQLYVAGGEVLPQVLERERARDRQGRRRAAQQPGERDLGRALRRGGLRCQRAQASCRRAAGSRGRTAMPSLAQ